MTAIDRIELTKGGKMSKDSNIRWGWLKGMYFLIIIHAGGSGLGMILIPSAVRSFFG